ncbi:YggT family protein [Stackebrandtia albiflava]|uniref:YggT family protein n=1 Tax=Stackebrandtia albiflava TaxID=406432 RepID=A0A562VBQ4_9ACTN|nr:YggT family protein [Stackebrandtia albiflava]TWJ15282.1 YggT family protein [Stackebrandtia albiflava]
MTALWQIVYLALYVFYLLMLARLVAGMVMRFARRWHPGRAASITLEVVFSATDPPLKGLRRLMPPLRLGNVALDLAFVVLLIFVIVLKTYVVAPLMYLP